MSDRTANPEGSAQSGTVSPLYADRAAQSGGPDGRGFLNLVLAVALVCMLGWLLIIGKSVLLPIVLAVIAVYVLKTAARTLGRAPLVRLLPSVVLHLLVLLCFNFAVVALGLIVSITLNDLVAAMPRYQQNLESLAGNVSEMVGMESPTWDEIVELTLGSLNLQAIALRVLGGASSLGLLFILVIIYAGFLMVEQRTFTDKLAVALPHGDRADRVWQILREANSTIGDYLAIKTAVNIILGALSFVILWYMGIDFALFWAVMIALSNYIPYVGSVVGVGLPVTLSLAQFGSLGTTAVLGALLIAVQTYVANVLEPRMMGKALNLSPFVILVALATWSSLWGLPGALLAVPFTAMVAILCNAFPATRFIGALLANGPGQSPRG